MIKDAKPVVLMNYYFEHRKKIKIDKFCLDFSDNQDTDAKKKNNKLLVECLFTDVSFSIEVSEGHI